MNKMMMMINKHNNKKMKMKKINHLFLNLEWSVSVMPKQRNERDKRNKKKIRNRLLKNSYRSKDN
jgi:hypothetical protein